MTRARVGESWGHRGEINRLGASLTPAMKGTLRRGWDRASRADELMRAKGCPAAMQDYYLEATPPMTAVGMLGRLG